MFPTKLTNQIIFPFLLLVIKTSSRRVSDAVSHNFFTVYTIAISFALTVCPGGVVEAYPPSDSVTCLTVDLLLEPRGKVSMLSCGDQLHGSCCLKALGFTVPQTSVHPETLNSICMRVGQACLQRHVIGYVSVDLVTFLDRKTAEQKVKMGGTRAEQDEFMLLKHILGLFSF